LRPADRGGCVAPPGQVHPDEGAQGYPIVRRRNKRGGAPVGAPKSAGENRALRCNRYGSSVPRLPVTEIPVLSLRRVVSLTAASTEIVCALECGDRLVGRGPECDFPSGVRRLPVVGPRPSAPAAAPLRRSARPRTKLLDRAALAALAPDLVLARRLEELGRQSAARALSAPDASPRVLEFAPGQLADLWRDMRRISEALGVPERGVQLVTRLVRRLRAIAERTQELTRPRVLLLEAIEPAVVAGWWLPELVSFAGAEPQLISPGEPPGVRPWTRIREADPDVVVFAPRGDDLARARERWREAAAAGARLLELRATRHGGLVLADGGGTFHRPGPRVAETLEILAEALHPEAFRFGHEGRGWERWRPVPR